MQDFYVILDPDRKALLLQRLIALDNSTVGVGECLLMTDYEQTSAFLKKIHLPSMDADATQMHHWLLRSRIQVLEKLLFESSGFRQWCTDTIAGFPDFQSNIVICLNQAMDLGIIHEVAQVVAHLHPHHTQFDIRLQVVFLRSFFMLGCNHIDEASQYLDELSPLSILPGTEVLGDAGYLLHNLLQTSNNQHIPMETLDKVLRVFERISSIPNLGTIKLRGLDSSSWEKIIQWIAKTLGVEGKPRLVTMMNKFEIASTVLTLTTLELPTEEAKLPLRKWEELLESPLPAPSTPRMRPATHSAEMLGFMTVSPPNALLRSPEIKGLTKTYSNNDFRQMRQVSFARQNTSRLPSMHVDVCIGCT